MIRNRGSLSHYGASWAAILCVAALLSGPSYVVATQFTTTNDITLREYVDVRFEAQQKAVESALAAADRAVQKAEVASDKRFDSVNEFRNTLSDQTRTLIPRTEAEQQFKDVGEKLANLTTRLNAIEDRGRGASDSWLILIAVIGVIGTIGGFAFALFRTVRPAK
jgi:hypothetical protein